MVRNNALVRLRDTKGACLVARFLNGYMSPLRNVIQSVKIMFHLDEVLVIEHRSEDGISYGFIGMVQEGGDSAAMRDMSRRASALRCNGLVLLKDAGLNTLAQGGVTHVGKGEEMISTRWLVFLNYHDVDIRVKSAVYGASQWLLYARTVDTQDYVLVDSGEVAQSVTEDITWTGDLPLTPVVVGTVRRLTLRLDVVNSEGTYSVTSGPYTIHSAIFDYTIYICTNKQSAWNAGQAVTAYMSDALGEFLLGYNPVYIADEYVPLSDIPDSGKVYRLGSLGQFMELTEGRYNLNAAVGFYYIGGRISYVYKPNGASVTPHWKIVITVTMDVAGSEEGWPDAATSGFMYRIQVNARYEAVGGITTAPSTAVISNINVREVDAQGLLVTSFIWDRTSWDSSTVLTLSNSVRSGSAGTLYARQIPNTDAPSGVMVYSYNLSPSDITNESIITPIN